MAVHEFNQRVRLVGIGFFMHTMAEIEDVADVTGTIQHQFGLG